MDVHKLIAGLETAVDVELLTREIFGAEPLREGILHPAAAWRRGGDLVSLNIGPDTPKSDLDSFSLNLARARSDAIVTTGRILRCEPALRHCLQGPGATG